MIVAEIGNVIVSWADGELLLARGSDVEQERIRAAFARPATLQRPVTVDGGGIEERLVKFAPGSYEHALGVLRKLRAVIALDTG